MGDLKKKKVDYIAKTDEDKEILMEHRKKSIDDQTLERLREYMKIFVEKQNDKQKDEE